MTAGSKKRQLAQVVVLRSATVGTLGLWAAVGHVIDRVEEADTLSGFDELHHQTGQLRVPLFHLLIAAFSRIPFANSNQGLIGITTLAILCSQLFLSDVGC